MSTLQPSNNSRPLENMQILLAEDCAEESRLYLKFFEKAGAEVTLECNGQSAVDAIRRSPSRFDAIVMDFQMPEMDGIIATSKIRKLGFEGAIIAITAFSTKELRENWYRAGCDNYLEKPVQQPLLIETVQQCIEMTAKTV